MACLSVAFPLHFYAPLFHFLAMLFRHSSFQFYAYAIGLIAVPLLRFTIPMHCPGDSMPLPSYAIQFHCVTVHRPAIPLPVHLFLCHSPAQPYHAIPMLIKSFQRNSFPIHGVSLPSFATANLLSAIPALISSLLHHSDANPRFSSPFQGLAYQGYSFSFPRFTQLFHRSSSPVYALTYSHVNAPLPLFLHWPMPLREP